LDTLLDPSGEEGPAVLRQGRTNTEHLLRSFPLAEHNFTTPLSQWSGMVYMSVFQILDREVRQAF
jgi:hypothetical protein